MEKVTHQTVGTVLRQFDESDLEHPEVGIQSSVIR